MRLKAPIGDFYVADQSTLRAEKLKTERKSPKESLSSRKFSKNARKPVFDAKPR